MKVDKTLCVYTPREYLLGTLTAIGSRILARLPRSGIGGGIGGGIGAGAVRG